MLLKELIQRVQSLYSKGVESDDSRLSSRHIYNKLKTVRASLLSKAAQKKQRISQWNYQTITCIEMIKVPAHECPCLPPIGCELLRSKYKVPAPLSDLNGDLIEWVRSIDKHIKIDRITSNALTAQKGNKYTPLKVQFFIENEYLYLSTPSKMKVLAMRALFEDPLEVDKFQGYCDTCTDCDCTDYLGSEFPLDNDLIDTAIEMSARELISVFAQMSEDLSNNSRDNLIEQAK